jgi:biotin carboxyl carrier protein
LKLDIEIDGKPRAVETARAGDRLRFAIDGKTVEADAVQISSGVFSILIDGESFEVRVEETAGGLRAMVRGREYAAVVSDPRQWRRHCGAALEAEGRQQVLAPMPGKIVGVLAKAGDAVTAGQGLLVIEAMKMRNEVRSPKSGIVERLLVNEGQAVNAGELLAVVS